MVDNKPSVISGMILLLRITMPLIVMSWSISVGFSFLMLVVFSALYGLTCNKKVLINYFVLITHFYPFNLVLVTRLHDKMFTRREKFVFGKMPNLPSKNTSTQQMKSR